ncbi:MAG TPA: hypothetical protein DE315_05635 [Candidatus Omnitrophica bacterium]|nr:hypothetical protein [Candidatus Omnitrophota bacterium]HCI44989.1 hypothetical protein [Candidatus Omnitrophota bacterium]
MGSSYYYFVASLPLLSFDGKMPMTVEVFREDCRRLLSGDHYALMEQLWAPDEILPVPVPGTGTGAGNRVLDAWLHFDHGFRNELAWYRADHLNKDPLKYLRGARTLVSSGAEDIQRALKTGDLREAEKILSKARWQFLDELGMGHYYDFASVFIYYLKLEILKCHQEYGSPEGRNRLREIKTMPLPESCVMAKAG